MSGPTDLGDDPITDLVHRADLDGLVRLIDSFTTDREWSELLRLRDRARAAVETGRQLWPAATLAEAAVTPQVPVVGTKETRSGLTALLASCPVKWSVHGTPAVQVWCWSLGEGPRMVRVPSLVEKSAAEPQPSPRSTQ